VYWAIKKPPGTLNIPGAVVYTPCEAA